MVQSGCESRPRGVRCDARTTRLAWGPPSWATRRTGPIRRPGDRPRKGGREELNHERRETEALASEARRRRCRTANSLPRWIPESFCVLLGENSARTRGEATMPG